MVLSRVFHEIPFPLVYTPIKCNNPIVTCRLENRVTVKIGTDTDKNIVHLEYDTRFNEYRLYLEEILKKFFNIVSENITQEKYVVEVSIEENTYGLGLYVVVTDWFLRSIGVSDNDLQIVSTIIDSEIFGDPVVLSMLKALRKSILLSKNIIYREGEEPVELVVDYGFSVEEHLKIKTSTIVEDLLNEQAFRTAIIHLGGYTAIALARCLLSRSRSECKSLVTESLHVLNSLQYMLKGVTPPVNGVLVDDVPGYLTMLVPRIDDIE